MIVLIILIAQSVTLLFGTPTLILWGFLILNLLLQTSLITNSGESISSYKRSIIYCQLIKIFSGVVICVQIVYAFLTNAAFMEHYGFSEDYFEQSLGALYY